MILTLAPAIAALGPDKSDWCVTLAPGKADSSQRNSAADRSGCLVCTAAALSSSAAAPASEGNPAPNAILLETLAAGPLPALLSEAAGHHQPIRAPPPEIAGFGPAPGGKGCALT